MLIFNCSEAASKVFSRVQKGKIVTPVKTPPSPIIEDDEPGDLDEQWLLHAITVQRKNVLFAIHIETRYCMIFVDVKKADIDGFACRFADRWIEGQTRYALQLDVLKWVVDSELMLQRLATSCAEYTLYRRGHRGAQAHLNDVIWNFEEYAHRWQSLPDNRASLLFDAQLNHTPRLSKGHKNYYWPDEQMMAHWLRRYGGMDEAGILAARKRRLEVQREMAELRGQLRHDG